MKMRVLRLFFIIVVTFSISLMIAAPTLRYEKINVAGRELSIPLGVPKVNFSVLGKQISTDLPFKKGLDIQGGMQVVLEADMSQVGQADREIALESAKAVIMRRVDL